MRVLVVEDDLPTAAMLRRGLELAGHDVEAVCEGVAVVEHSGVGGFDAVILDLNLTEGLDGVEVCRQLRDADFWGAIVMLTARDAVGDRVRGLDAGADDYVVKPFVLADLLARLRAQSRRPAEPRPVMLANGDLRLDPATRRCWRGEVEIRLSRREYGLLLELLRHPGEVLTREHLLDHVWDDPDAISSNIVDQTIGYLRRKIDAPFGTRDVQAVRGTGYRLACGPPTAADGPHRHDTSRGDAPVARAGREAAPPPPE